MVAKKELNKKEQSPEQGEIQFETPWKMLGVFAIIFLGLVVYGFVN
jgi:hypothetical protein